MKFNKSLKSFLVVSSVILLASCKSEINTSFETKKNKTEIEKLKKQLKDLQDRGNVSGGTTSSEEIESLKKEILSLLSALEEKIDSNVENLKVQINEIKIDEDDLANTYVSKEDYQVLVATLENEYLKKRDLVIQNGRIVIDGEGLEKLIEKIDVIQEELNTFKALTNENFKKIDESWTLRLKEELGKSENKITEEVKVMIEKEVVRLKLSIEGLDNKIQEINQRIDSLNDYSDSLSSEEIEELIEKQLSIYKIELNEFKERQDNFQKQIQNIQDTLAGSGDSASDKLVGQIVAKLFKPCRQGLNDQALCYTMGVLINKFGGEFIDPTSFDKTKDGLVSYLSLSGVTSRAAIENMESYIVSTERTTFNKCFPGEKYLIAPQEFWPHLVINSFLFEKIAHVTESRKKAKLISDSIKVPTNFVAWYRNQCYQDDFFKRGLTDTRVSDHLFGAALDVSFRSINDLSFDYYNQFVENEVFEKDIFDILTPLKISGVKVQARHGFGVGRSKKFHLGILSQNTKGDAPYIIYNYKVNEELH